MTKLALKVSPNMDTLAVSFETFTFSQTSVTKLWRQATSLWRQKEHCWLCLFATAWCFPHLQETTCYSRAVTHTLAPFVVVVGAQGTSKRNRERDNPTPSLQPSLPTTKTSVEYNNNFTRALSSRPPSLSAPAASLCRNPDWCP